jgi:uncharacterized protein YhaN
MSPIGRVFIVLNLALAAGFVVVSGTHLQKQHNYKSQLEAEKAARKTQVDELNNTIATLTGDRQKFENAKTAAETQLGAERNANSQLQDENKRLSQQLSQIEADMKGVLAQAQAANTEMKAAFAQAKSAYDMAIADQKVKDEAVRAKDAALAENHELNNKIKELTEAVATRDGKINGLETDKSQLTLLVKVAESYGFLRSMAAPNLSGTVTTSNGRLCTIQVTDNPGNVDIQQAIEQGRWTFAIYDDKGYKGEAVAEKYEASANAVLCKVMLEKGSIKEGDRAATKTP